MQFWLRQVGMAVNTLRSYKALALDPFKLPSAHLRDRR
jgi:hypothetical protein